MAGKHEAPREGHRAGDANGLPLWLNVVIVLTLLGTFVFVVVALREEGLRYGYMIAVLLGTYLGIDRVVRAWRGSL